MPCATWNHHDEPGLVRPPGVEAGNVTTFDLIAAGASVGKTGDSCVCGPGYSGGGPVVFFCHGQRPVSSTSSEKLRNVRMSTIAASTATVSR